MKEDIKKRVREALDSIPKGYLSDAVIKETIRCILYGFLKEQGYLPLPAYRNPRYPEGPVDMVGMAGHDMEVAFCSSPTIELEDVKKLERIPCDKKYVISFSRDDKKVGMSTFFLKPGIEHIRLYDAKK